MLDKTNRQDNLMQLKHLIQQSLAELEQLQSIHEEIPQSYHMLHEDIYSHHPMIHRRNQVPHSIQLPG